PEFQAAPAAGQHPSATAGWPPCHIPALPLSNNNNPGAPGQPGWVYTEPSPYNPTTGPNAPNLLPGPAMYPVTAPSVLVDLTSDKLPKPRLKASNGVVMVPAYTDLKLHTMADRPTDPIAESLDQNQPAGP